MVQWSTEMLVAHALYYVVECATCADEAKLTESMASQFRESAAPH